MINPTTHNREEKRVGRERRKMKKGRIQKQPRGQREKVLEVDPLLDITHIFDK